MSPGVSVRKKADGQSGIDFCTVPHKLAVVKIIICGMVQKKKKASAAKSDLPAKRRGRPRAFEPEIALSKAIDAFRDGGFAATSLDDLSEAMGINRPSLYGTFGDKRDLFLKAYQRYRQDTNAAFAEAFVPGLSLRRTLEKAYAVAIDIYLSGENGPRGCFTVMTATSEAMADPEIRALVQMAFSNGYRTLKNRFERAVAEGDLPPETNIAVLAQVSAGAFDTLAIRARAGVPRVELESIAANTVDFICG